MSSATVLLATSILLAPRAGPAQDTPPEVPKAQDAMAPERAEEARQALVEWFECEECEEGQLQAVVKHGPPVIPLLRSALLRGTAPATRELMRRSLAKRYDELVRFQKTHPYSKVGSSKEAFIATNIENLDARYQVRAAQALAAIGGAASRRALEEGLEAAKRSDVRESIKASMALPRR